MSDKKIVEVLVKEENICRNVRLAQEAYERTKPGGGGKYSQKSVVSEILKGLEALKDCEEKYYACSGCGVFLGPAMPYVKYCRRNHHYISIKGRKFRACFICGKGRNEAYPEIRIMEGGEKAMMIKDFKEWLEEIKKIEKDAYKPMANIKKGPGI